MGRKTGKKKKGQSKLEHHFIFKGMRGTYYPNAITVSYEPVNNKSSIPQFNRDKLFYTPSFIIPALYNRSPADYIEDHKKKVNNYEQISQCNILVPKPRSKHKICSVCRAEWQDYKQHIQSEFHKAELRKNKFYSHISALTQKYRERNENAQRQRALRLRQNEKQERSQREVESTISWEKNQAERKEQVDV